MVKVQFICNRIDEMKDIITLLYCRICKGNYNVNKVLEQIYMKQFVDKGDPPLLSNYGRAVGSRCKEVQLDIPSLQMLQRIRSKY
jgi:hypothetical protein